MALYAKEHMNEVIDRLQIANKIAKESIQHHQEKFKKRFEKNAKEAEF